jgi:pimeloyl-ACP methyl ester carboxylesterase
MQWAERAHLGDQLISPENAVDRAEAIEGSRLALVPDAGHMIAQEQPAAVAAALAELLAAAMP